VKCHSLDGATLETTAYTRGQYLAVIIQCLPV